MHNKKAPVVVVYRKNAKSKKQYLTVFHNVLVDDVLTTRKKKPLLNDDYIIDEIGIGSSFIETYKKKFNIKKVSKNG